MERLITHRVERRPRRLRVFIEVDLDAACWSDKFPAQWHTYLEVVEQDLLEVAALLRQEPETGRVKWFDEQKGYGYITSMDRQDVFVHYSQIAGDGFKTLEKGQPVKFKRRMGRLSIEAIDVVPEGPCASGG